MNKNVTAKIISQASCTLNISPVAISSTVTITNAGAGYVVPPIITFVGGGGSGATATASIHASGIVTDVTVTNAGTGYTSIPTVVVSVAGNTSQPTTTAVLTAALAPFIIGSVTLDNPGSGYLSATPPVVTIAGYTGTTAPTVTAIVNTAGFVTGFTFTAGVGLTAKGTATIAPPVVGTVGTPSVGIAVGSLFGSIVKIPNVGAGEIDVTSISFMAAGGGGSGPITATTVLDVILLKSNLFATLAPYAAINVSGPNNDLDRVMSINTLTGANCFSTIGVGQQFGQLNKTGAAVRIPINTLPTGDIWVAVIVRGAVTTFQNIALSEITLGLEIKR